MAPKKPPAATADDLNEARAQLQAEADAAKKAGLQAAEKVRAELLTELGKVKQDIAAQAQTSQEATNRIAQDSASYAKACSDGLRQELLPMLDELTAHIDAKVKAAQAHIDSQVQNLDADLKAVFADELMALTQQVEQELTDLKAHMDKWGKEMADEFVARDAKNDAAMDVLRQEAAASVAARQQELANESQRIVDAQKKVDDLQNERNERAQNEIWLKLERVEELVQEVKDGAKEQTAEVDTRMNSAVSALRHDAERRLAHLDEQAGKLQDAVAEVENISTRRVDWVIRNVSKRIRPPSASKACLHTSWFSPKFDMAGAHGLQLELQLFRDSDPPVEGQAAGDCAAFLWACKGMNLMYKLYIGTKSAQLEKVFNGRVPYGTKRLCFLKDQINREEDSLRVSIEILEAVREIEHPIKPPAPPAEGVVETEEDIRMKPLEGKVVFRRHVNNRMLDQVKAQVETMRSRMVRRVEWRLEQASMLRRCFPQGEPMCSAAFAAAGVDGLQLMFYPGGYAGCTDGFCSLFLYAQAGTMLKYTLYAGTHRRDATNFFENSGAFGRTNFCRFENIIDEDTDTILLAMEIDEAHQDVTAKIAHPIVAPGDRRSQAEIDGALPKAVESVVKMSRVPGKIASSLEERRVLPSLWTAKSLGEKGGPNDMRSFDDLKTSRSTPTASRSRPPQSPVNFDNTSPLSASRSMPSLTKDFNSTDLPQLSKTTGGDWARTGLAPQKVKGSSKPRGKLNSTMQVLEPGSVH